MSIVRHGGICKLSSIVNMGSIEVQVNMTRKCLRKAEGFSMTLVVYRQRHTQLKREGLHRSVFRRDVYRSALKSQQTMNE